MEFIKAKNTGSAINEHDLLNRSLIFLVTACALLFLSLSSFQAFAETTVFTESPIEFTKPNFADPFEEASQDRITDNVSITRADTQGLFNAVSEPFHRSSESPAGTRWAFSGLSGNPTGNDFSASEFANLNFDVWAASLGGTGGSLRSNIMNRPGVVHLIEDDIYIDIMFTAWSSGNDGGGFTYTRATAPAATVSVPIPLYALALLSLGLVFIARKKY